MDSPILSNVYCIKVVLKVSLGDAFVSDYNDMSGDYCLVHFKSNAMKFPESEADDIAHELLGTGKFEEVLLIPAY